MCGKDRPKLPQIKIIFLSEGLPEGNLSEDNSLIWLPLLRFCLLALSKAYLRAYENNNEDEIGKIKGNFFVSFCFRSSVSVETLAVLRLVREPQVEQNH